MAELLTLATVAFAVSAALHRGAQASVGFMAVASFFLAARIGLDDPVLGGGVILFQAVLGPVVLMHVRRHDADRHAPPSIAALIMGIGLAVVLVVLLPVATSSPSQATEPISEWSSAGLIVLVSALTLLIGATLVVRVREGRRS